MSKITFGASSWPFQWNPPYEDVIRRVSALGFGAIELIAWDDELLGSYYTKQKIRELRLELKSSGIFPSQFVFTPHDLSHPDEGKRAAAVTAWRRAVEVGAELGAPLINMVSAHPFAMRAGVDLPLITTKPLSQKYASINVPRGGDWELNYRQYVDALRTCAKACEVAGVVATIEPHPGCYLGNHDGSLRVLEHVGSDALGINLDPSHTFPVGDFPDITVYRLGKRIKHLHASDNDGVTNVHWRPGMGKIDWKAMFQALKDVDYDGVVSIELEDVPGVSREPTSKWGGVPVASPAFEAETVAGADFLKSICRELQIPVA